MEIKEIAPEPMTPKAPTQNEAQIRAKIESEYGDLKAMFQVAARVLAIRFFLFLTLAGSFALSIIATQNQSVQSLWVLIAYSFLTTFPLAYLEIRNKTGG